jgi:3-deoxy-manno-octulosonate cytidylyltransferase (CMP-KDO synthetase)
MRIAGIIPARYDSSRFPGKPLVVINGKSMIRRVYEQALRCDALLKVIVATDHEAILNHVRSFGGEVLMTSMAHRSGTERCSEVAALLESGGEEYTYYINIQGDEPYIDPKQISQLISCLKDHQPSIATLVKKIDDPGDISNPNVVKVVLAIDGSALYFSRTAIPFHRSGNSSGQTVLPVYYKHIGIYGYRSDALHTIVKLEPSPAEISESLEQLRWLEHGVSIRTAITTLESIAIDVPTDVLKIPLSMSRES